MKRWFNRRLRLVALTLGFPVMYAGSYLYLRLSGQVYKYPTDNHGAWLIEAAKPVPFFSLGFPTQEDLDDIERQRRLAPVLDAIYKPLRNLELLYANYYRPPEPLPKADASSIRAGVCQKAHRDLHAVCAAYYRANGHWPTNDRATTAFADEKRIPLKSEFLGTLTFEVDTNGSLTIRHEGPDGRGIAELTKQFPFISMDSETN
jgi:hypothetical protein